MHPALSIILFTTASGAGYGLLFLIGLLCGTSLLPESRWFALVSFFICFALISFGLIASTFHLGHPERAWRAISQWRSSWLSREGALALAVFPPAAALALSWILAGDVHPWLGWVTAVLAVLTVYCTAMIYASLKPIPFWHNPWVPVNYLLLGLMCGALLLNALLYIFSAPPVPFACFTLITILLGLAAKLTYWQLVDGSPAMSSAESATGLGSFGRVRLLEANTGESYVMKEMGHALARKHAAKLRTIALVLAFLSPLVLTALSLILPALLATALAVMAAISGLSGVLIERWLFFAEARHSVMLYYGAAAV
jgi:sulfite dehydrogenase (quinone) subunit SoeC